jgi:DNA helicase-2/ATP-dependent DNA helicase PcrA
VRILERDLDDEQLEIAKAADRSLLVVACPGSGKTRLLTSLAAYVVRRSHPANWRVLCLTFSVEAARQMRRRVAQRELEVPAPRRIEVTNFHGFALELLGHHGHHIDWPRDAQVIDVLEAQEIAKEVAEGLGLHALSGADAYQAIQRLRNNRPVVGASVARESLLALRDGYIHRLATLRVRDFDDLILHAIYLLDTVPAVADIIRATYRYIVVDELQDTSGWQLEFVDRISGRGATTVFAVADDDQMIYEWRDARAENIAEWQERFGAERVALLGNYRCPPRIVEIANQLIAHNREPEDARVLPYSRVEGRPGEVLVLHVANEYDEGRTVAALVAERLAAGIPPAKVAILASVRFLLDPSIAALTDREIHFVQVGDDPLANSPFARALRAVLVLATTPGQHRARERLDRMLADTVEVEDLDAVVDDLVGQRTIGSMIERLAVVAGRPTVDEAVERTRQVVALSERERGVEPPAEVGRRIALDWHRLSRQLQRETDAVKVMTTFSAKGLEFDTVIVPGFNDQLVPYVRKGTAQTAVWWAEERRKVYVAVTRTEAMLAIVSRDDRAPSRFVAEMGIEAEEHVAWDWADG